MKKSCIFGLLGLLWGCAPNPSTPSTPSPQAAAPSAVPATTAAPEATASPVATPAPSGKTGAAGKTVTSKSGLKHVVIRPGKGAVAKKGSRVYVHYTGVLENGTKFDSSRDRGQPIDFVLGTGRVIAGWEEGLEGMKVGEQRKLTIPPALGYGEQGFGNAIPGGATLIFDVEMVKVE